MEALGRMHGTLLLEALLFALLTWLSSFHSPLEAKLPKVLCGWSRRLGCSPLAFHRRDHCKILTYFKINVSKKLASSARPTFKVLFSHSSGLLFPNVSGAQSFSHRRSALRFHLLSSQSEHPSGLWIDHIVGLSRSAGCSHRISEPLYGRRHSSQSWVRTAGKPWPLELSGYFL